MGEAGQPVGDPFVLGGAAGGVSTAGGNSSGGSSNGGAAGGIARGGANAEPDLMLRLDFENNGVDSSGNANNAVPYGGPTFVPGRFGMATRLSGKAHFEVPTVPPDNLDVDLGSYTISAWFNQTTDVPANEYASWIVNRQDSATNADDFSLGVSGMGSQALRGGVDAAQFVDTTRVTNGTWMFAAITVARAPQGQNSVMNLWKKTTGGGLTLVKNTGFSPGNRPAGPDVFIGAERGESSGNVGLYHFQGLIDDVRIYKRALTQLELDSVAAGNRADMR